MVSCVDTVILPDNKTVDEDFWKKKSEVQAVVGAAYAQLRDASAIRNMIVWGDFRSDELVMASSLPATSGYYIALSQIYSMNIEPENAFTTWYPFYSAINYCNLVLQKAEGVLKNDPDYLEDDYNANRSQMLALRAFCYFYLTQVFHDIPVTPAAYLNSSDDLNAPQSNPDSVLTMCISDLEEAAKYAIPGNTYGDWRDRGYLNKDGINAILADIHLWRGSINRDAKDYQACVDYCDKIIAAKKTAYENSGMRRFPRQDDVEKDYYLSSYSDMYNDVFGQQGQNADESIFEIQFKSSNATNAGLYQMFYAYNNKSTDGFGYLKASTKYGSVDGTGKGVWNNADDQRLYEFLYNAGTTAEQYDIRKGIAYESAGVNKKADGTRLVIDPDQMYHNWIIYRLTDIMLMKAEALVQLYELGDKDATDTRNEDAFNICKFVNDRSLQDADLASKGLVYVAYKDKMESLVLAERARELCFEGKRWFDLMRYNYRHTAEKADLKQMLNDHYVENSDAFFELALRKYAVPSAMKAKMRDERYLYMPLNYDEVELNTNLEQNTAYKSSKKKSKTN